MHIQIPDNKNRFTQGISLEKLINPHVEQISYDYKIASQAENISSKNIIALKNDLSYLSKYSLKDFIEKEKVLVFPHSFGMGDSSQKIIEFEQTESGDTIYTGNIMGFVGRNDTTLTIYSRFDCDKNCIKNNFFFHYMLRKINALNIFNLPTSYTHGKMQDLLLYLFPAYLKKAIKQGIYKEYQQKRCNDANIKGRIDINRHIQKNIPFNGKVAYTMREHSVDNTVTELIRHCIEYMRGHPIGRHLLLNDADIKDATRIICNATPSYSLNNRQKIIAKNKRPVNHPYFSDYRQLQKLCNMILTHQGYHYTASNKKVHGILFDGAWLWEEYIAKILPSKFKHYTRNNSKSLYLFEKNNQKIIPDYVNKVDNIVADAKYIPLDNLNNTLGEERATSIYYKTIAYMYRLNSPIGYLFYPTAEENKKDILKIQENNGRIIKLGLQIPKETEYYKFCKKMKINEDAFINNIQGVKAD